MNCIKNGKYTGDSCFGCGVKVEDCEIRDRVYRNRWIPVGERLPEYGERVLVCNDEGIMGTAIRLEGGIHPLGWQICYCLYDSDYWDDDENGLIKAWQPLPEPYQGGSQDDIK